MVWMYIIKIWDIRSWPPYLENPKGGSLKNVTVLYYAQNKTEDEKINFEAETDHMTGARNNKCETGIV